MIFFSLLSEWVPEPCLSVRSDLRQLRSCPPKPRQVWSHQVVQRSIRCCQSKFLFRFSNLPLPASACRKVANWNPRRRRNLKNCVMKVSSSFRFFPLQIRTEERVRSAFCDLCNPNFPESLKSNGCIWCLNGGFLFLMNLLPFLNYFTHSGPDLLEGV